jgi:hypothetical protein
MINAFEKKLVASGTHIIKIFLHISPEEQLRRFKKRLDDPACHWKISEGDYSERAFWDDYTKAYEDALSQTSTRHAPWFVIPANRKWFRNLAVAKIVVETMAAMNMKFPAPKVNLQKIARKFHEEEKGEEKKIGKKKWKKFIAGEGLMPKTGKNKKDGRAKRARTSPKASQRKKRSAPVAKPARKAMPSPPVNPPAPQPVGLAES